MCDCVGSGERAGTEDENFKGKHAIVMARGAGTLKGRTYTVRTVWAIAESLVRALLLLEARGTRVPVCSPAYVYYRLV